MLIPNAGAVARRSYSMWAFYVLGALQLAELVPDLLAPYGWFGLSPTVVGVLSLLAAFAGGARRFLARRDGRGALAARPGHGVGGRAGACRRFRRRLGGVAALAI